MSAKRHKIKPTRRGVKHHACQPFIHPNKTHAYAYCGICGRAMSNVPIARLKAALEKSKEQFAEIDKRVELLQPNPEVRLAQNETI